MNRRGFLGLLAAPAIIRVADIMPVRAVPIEVGRQGLWSGPPIPQRWLYAHTPTAGHIAALQEQAALRMRMAFREAETRWLASLAEYQGQFCSTLGAPVDFVVRDGNGG